MTTTFSFGVAAGIVLAIAIAWLARLGGEPTVAIDSLSHDDQALLAPWLHDYKDESVPLSTLKEWWSQAARSAAAQRQAIKEEAAANTERQQAWLEQEVARRTRAYSREVPLPVQAVIDRQIKAQAEAEAGIPALQAKIDELSGQVRDISAERDAAQADRERIAHTNAQMVESYKELRRQAEQLSSTRTQQGSGNQAQLQKLTAENRELRQALDSYCREIKRLRWFEQAYARLQAQGSDLADAQ